MIIDLPRFIAAESPFWRELEGMLDRLERRPETRLDLAGLERFHYLYERAAADLGRLATFAAEPHTRRRLEQLVARAYSEVHALRRPGRRAGWLRRAAGAFPASFRRRRRAFAVSLAATLAGALFGAFIAAAAPQHKPALIPFEGLHGSPAERVAQEEGAGADRLAGKKSRFAAQLMANNIQVSIQAFALGVSWGIGTLIVLFYNGVILGLVGLDYLLHGQWRFLCGWLLPHGAVEIPAILIAGQAGLVLGGALLGVGREAGLRERLAAVRGDLTALILGAAAMLVWAGVVEAFLSQLHEPLIAYEIKIGFGLVELALLGLYLGRAGRAAERPEALP
jgi:uncharacterized membrane protein SpoIIM required for sporulation